MQVKSVSERLKYAVEICTYKVIQAELESVIILLNLKKKDRNS